MHFKVLLNFKCNFNNNNKIFLVTFIDYFNHFYVDIQKLRFRVHVLQFLSSN